MSKNVCMVVYSYYPRDHRVRKEAEALARNGFDVEVFCLKQQGESKLEKISGVTAKRFPMMTARERGLFRYFIQYIIFFVVAFFYISATYPVRRYKFLHMHSLPDFIVFAALIPKMFGAVVILDLHEAMPEIFLSKMKASKSSRFYAWFIIIEKISARFATKVITVSDLIGSIMINRGLDPKKLTAIYNAPDLKETLKPKLERKDIFVYAGSLNEYQDFETLLTAIDSVPDTELQIYGDGIMSNRVIELISSRNIHNAFFNGWINPFELRKTIIDYSGAIVPFVDTEITRIAIGHKTLEFSLLGLPVIAADLPGIRDVFDDSCIYYYKPGDTEDLIRAIKEVKADRNKAANKVLQAQAKIFEKGLTWDQVEKKLISLYE